MFLISFCSCISQEFKYKSTNHDFESFKQNRGNEVRIVDYLPKNYVKDSSVDYTKYVQLALDENKDVIFPNFPILINDNGIVLSSNTNIYFDVNSKLILKQSSKESYSMLKIYNVENVNLFNVHLVGDRYQHIGSEGEWGMGIRIQNAKNINIYNSTIRDMWGDGIYITSFGNTSNQNILIQSSWIDNTRRNGISIISGEDINIDYVKISNTNGTAPASGIDIEPNNTSNKVKNIILSNIITYNNQRDGIVLDFTNLVHDGGINEVKVTINNHIDIGSNYGLFLAGFRKLNKGSRPLEGEIVIKNVNWIGSRSNNALRIGKGSEYFPDVIFENVIIENLKQDNKIGVLKGIIKEKGNFFLQK